jgi:hypothetical protein
VDSIGVIGLVAGLWFALSPTDEQRRSATVWLGWVLAGASMVLLLAGALTEPLAPETGVTVSTDWPEDPTSGPSPPGTVGGTGDPRVGAPVASGSACSLTCG